MKIWHSTRRRWWGKCSNWELGGINKNMLLLCENKIRETCPTLQTNPRLLVLHTKISQVQITKGRMMGVQTWCKKQETTKKFDKGSWDNMIPVRENEMSPSCKSAPMINMEEIIKRAYESMLRSNLYSNCETCHVARMIKYSTYPSMCFHSRLLSILVFISSRSISLWVIIYLSIWAFQFWCSEDLVACEWLIS